MGDPSELRRDWWAVQLMPAGVLEELEVFALQHVMPMLYLTTNDIVFVREGVAHVLEHEACAPAEPDWQHLTPHVPRHLLDPASRPGERRRLESLPTREAPRLPVAVQDGEVVRRSDGPSELHAGRRVDLAPALAPELSRVLRSGDPDALSAMLALLDLLARFDGHRRGEVEIAASQSRRASNLRVGLGEPGVALLGDRVNRATRGRVAAALAAGVSADRSRVRALIDKREALSSSSGHLARLCLAALEVSPGGFVYEDEVPWSEYEPGVEYS